VPSAPLRFTGVHANAATFSLLGATSKVAPCKYFSATKWELHHAAFSTSFASKRTDGLSDVKLSTQE